MCFCSDGVYVTNQWSYFHDSLTQGAQMQGLVNYEIYDLQASGSLKSARLKHNLVSLLQITFSIE